jgi:5-oxoprolinase (ATP-hydrolysing)
MDQGGTFTDVVRPAPGGGVVLEKRLTSDADLGALADGDPAPRRGTTAATNALLEGRERPVLLLTTAGLEDIERVGDGRRGALFSLDPPRRRVVARRALGIPGRILADGTVEQPVDLDRARAKISRVLEDTDVEAVAVVLLHGPKAPAQEHALAELCRALGVAQVSVGNELAPSEGFLGRVQTTVVDAALSPLLPRAAGQYMRSDGGMAPHRSSDWTGCHSVLSGPAGGVVAAQALRQQLDPEGLAFTLDMGGTSTDTACLHGALRRRDHLDVAGLRLRVPAVELHTVAAGGGSRLRVVGGLYQVGPDSAGARPGPACYGRGGPATVTDCEAVLGRLPGFPPVCGPGADQPLALAAARAAIQALDPTRPVEEVAAGFRAVAHAAMARAVDAIAAARGVDPRAGALVAFGGAGPGHACGVARTLGARRVVVPLLAGAFSAVGIGIAGRRHEQVLPLAHRSLDDLEQAITAPFSGTLELRLGARVVGTSPVLELAISTAELRALGHHAPRHTGGLPRLEPGPLRDRFDALHAEELGFARPGLPVELVELRCATTAASRPLPLPGQRGPRPATTVEAWFDGTRSVPLIDGHDTEQLCGLRGPALVALPGCTVVVEPGWRVEPGPHALVLVDERPPPRRLPTTRSSRDTAIFASRIMAVAEHMGARLGRLSQSVSIREREDYSCAVFDAAGHLVANAPHVPVHLGAMGETLRHLRQSGPLPAGTMWLSNDPYHGGSHLPDLTLMAPVHDEDGVLVGHVGCRAHHVDVGGTHAGSMPPSARHIDEEGIVITRHCLVDGDTLRLPALEGCREPGVVAADLEAQAAACAAGVERLRALAQELGREGFIAQLQHLQDAVAEGTAVALGAWARSRPGPPRGQATERLDDGSPLSVDLALDPTGLRLRLSAPAHAGNRNAPGAVARAVVLYVLRCLQKDHQALPMNEGALRTVQLARQPGGLFDPVWPRAVAGGNVETSQRLADALLRALGQSAASQGTMNNLTVQTPAGAWYETIAGGAGAGPGRHGQDAVQVHMTNTRNTDVEVLERRFPVVLRALRIRRDSGGTGRWRGGAGLEKVWEFQAPVEVALMAGRRAAGAPGAAGGGPGLPGHDEVRQAGQWSPLHGTARLAAGDQLRILTPGGGGWGAPTGD